MSKVRTKKKVKREIINTSKKILKVIKEKGCFSAKDFANDHEAYNVTKDDKKIIEVLMILQEATDEFMNRAQERLGDKSRSAQQKAEEALNIAEAIIEAEKEIRALELYNLHKVKERDLTILADV